MERRRQKLERAWARDRGPAAFRLEFWKSFGQEKKPAAAGPGGDVGDGGG